MSHSAFHPLVRFIQHSHPVSATDEQLMAAAFLRRTFAEGEALSRPGQVNRNLFFIARGVLRIRLINDAGVEVTHFFLKEDQFCTIQHSFINEVPAPESIEAACVADVLMISKTALLELYRQIPWLQGEIDAIIQQALLGKIQLRNSYLGLDASARYRLFLAKQGDVAARVSLHDTASYLGITQQSLSRIRRGV